MSEQRVLVIQPLQGVGDMVWHLNVIEGIAAQTERGKVALLTKKQSGSSSLLEPVGFVEEILWIERNPGPDDGLAGLWRAASRLRAGGFTSAWVLHASSRYGCLAWGAGIGERRGYGLGAQRCFLTDRRFLPREAKTWHPVDKARHLLSRHGVPLLHEEPQYPVDGKQKQSALTEYGHLPRPWFGFGFSSAGTAKRWPTEYFAMLGDRLIARTGGTVFLTGGPKDEEAANAIRRKMDSGHSRAFPIVPLSLSEVAAFLSCLDVFIGNDTGLLNLAAAVQIRCLGLFGASPPLTHSRFIAAIQPLEGIVIEDQRQMHKIGVDAVFQRLLELGWIK